MPDNDSIKRPQAAQSLPSLARPIFKPRELTTAEGEVWYVEAEWSDGTIEEIGRFTAVSDAWRWIAHHSRAWFNERVSS